MSDGAIAQAILGGLLIFVLPGFTITKAVFPEWRVLKRGALRRLAELVTLSLVTSVALTVLMGYVLLAAAPGGFQAFWSDPVLEIALAAITVVAFAFGLARQAYSRTPPPTTLPSPRPPDLEEKAWDVSGQLDRLQREERRLLRSLRRASADGSDAAELRQRLEEIRAETAAAGRAREGEILE